MKVKIILLLATLLLQSSSIAFAQKQAKAEWITISDDEIVSISYQSSISTDSKGNHTVWVKAVYHEREWQKLFL